MKLHPVQGRTRIQLENRAEETLLEIFPENLSKPNPLDVLKLIDIHLSQKYGWSLDVQEQLPAGILGYTDPQEKAVVISEDTYMGAVNGDGRPRFTIPHEYCHVDLHRDEMKNWMISYSPETERLYRLHESQIKIWENPEWQANYMAGALLMPKRMVLVLKRKFYSKEMCIQAMMDNFQVSYQAAEVRYRKVFS